MVILDVDGDEGMNSLRAFDYNVPTTLTCISGGKGYHFYYSLPDGLTLDKRRINLIKKVDLIVNGYVCAPPSIHPSGKPYIWQSDFNPDHIVEAPQWIIDICKKENEYIDDRVRPEQVLAGMDEGSRNVGLFRYACYLRGRKDLHEVEAITLMEKAASSCNPPYSTKEAATMLKRVWDNYKGAEVKRKRKLLKLKDLSQLKDPEFPIYEVIDGEEIGLISSGLVVVTSAPKSGKSALIAYIMSKVCTGQPLWGKFKTRQTSVLYLDLEQGPTFAKKRWEKIFAIKDLNDAPETIHLQFVWDRMDDGGLDQLKEALQDEPQIGIVVIDTLGDFWPTKMSGDGNAYNKEQFVMGEIVKLIDQFNITLILVHHDNKAATKTTELMKRGGGTYAIVGKAQTVINVQRNQNDVMGIIETSGKNVPARKISAQFDKKNFRWGYIGEEE